MDYNNRRAAILAQHGMTAELTRPDIYGIGALGSYDPEAVAASYPVDPRTGFPSTDLARIISEDTPPQVKERIMSRLQRVDGAFIPSGLSDEDVFQLVPPRYVLSDELTVERWRDYLAREVLPVFDAETRAAVQEQLEEQESSNSNTKTDEDEANS